ncbi:MAG: AAA family ATPase [Pseudobdellovibrionaceae bacterium]
MSRISSADLHKDLLVPYADYLESVSPDFEYVRNENADLPDLVRLLLLSNGAGRSVALIGGKGVGKKTLVGALVKGQHDNTMPPQLTLRPIYRLNVNLLFNSSGSAYAEERFNEVMNELKAIHERRGVKPLLVIDDGTSFIKNIASGNHSNIVHTLDDADNGSNYLDIILVTNDTSLAELREAHPSFMSDISTFKVEEPEKGTLLDILRSRAKTYAGKGITVPDEVLRKVIDVTTQYPRIFPFTQPKRAIRFMDEVAVGYELDMHAQPEGYGEKKAHLEQIERQIESVAVADRDSLISMRDTLKIEMAQDFANWSKARETLRTLQGEIQSFEGLIHIKGAENTKFKEDDRVRFAQEAKEARIALKEMAASGGNPATKGLSAERFGAMSDDDILAFAEFDINLNTNPKIRENERDIGRYEASIGKIVTGLKAQAKLLEFPVTVPEIYVEELAKKITKTDINPHMFEAMADSENLLNNVVLDQPIMNGAIASSLRIAAAGGNDPDKPLGVFLILGPSGVGKTFVAETLSELVYGSKEKFLSAFNMENYMQSQNVSSLIGAPPGLVGYGTRGQLIAAAQDRPYSVLLLDEIEKAHKDIKQTLLTALDKGRITGQDGEVGDLRNTIVVMTSNYGQDVFLDPSLSPEEAQRRVKERIYRDGVFSPEFLNRTTIVFANFLSPEAVVTIAQREAVKLAGRYRVKNPDLSISFPREAAQDLVTDMYRREQGARVVKSTVTQEVGNAAAEKIIETKKATGKPAAGELRATYVSGQGFDYAFIPEGADQSHAVANVPDTARDFAKAAPA